MGYAGKTKEKKKAIELRKKGLSYSEILKEVAVSKNSLSRWCRDIVLTPNQLSRLLGRKLSGAERGRLIGSKKQQKKRVLVTKKLYIEGKKEIGRLSERENFLVGVGLYLGDGSKGDSEVGFANSNADIIRFMMSWFRDFCRVKEQDFRGQIWIHDDLNAKKALGYWSKIMKIPQDQFRKTYIAISKDSRKIRKKIHKHGVCSIRISKSLLQRKILGWMGGVLGR